MAARSPGVSVVVALAGLAVSGPVAGRSAEPAQVDLVSFVSKQPGEVVVPVRIGDAGPFQLLLDTGSSHTAITQELSHLLAARPMARTSLASSTGSTEVLIVRLNDISVGAARVNELLATVLPRESTQILGRGLSGIIGQDFLGRFNFSLDYRRSKVRWFDAPPAGKGPRLALVPSEGRFLVQLPQGIGARTLQFVPDSGASGLLVFESAALAAGQGDTAIQVGSLAGAAVARSTRVTRLRVGNITLRQQPAALLASQSGGPSRGDGLLPLHLFDRVYFNNAEAYMMVE